MTSRGQYFRTVIVSDDPEFIRAAYAQIESEPGLIFVATADSGFAALITVNVLRPDLVLVDVAMSGMDGAETTRRLKARPEPATVVLITPHDSGEIARTAADSGADAVITRRELGESAESILRALAARPDRTSAAAPPWRDER